MSAPAPRLAASIERGRSVLDELVEWIELGHDALLGGALIAALLVAGLVTVRRLGVRYAREDRQGEARAIVARAAARTSTLFLLVLAANIVISYADAPPRLSRIIHAAFIVAAALQVAVWARELVLGLIGRRLALHSPDSALGSAMSLIRLLVSFGLFAVAVIVILDNLGVNVTALIAGLGIGGIAIGLAAQGIFSDLFAALSILFDRPFRRGDLIRYDNTTGTVERIGLKTTRLRSIDGEQVIMANTKLLERELHNFALSPVRRQLLTFGLAYNTEPEALRQVEAIARSVIEPIPGCSFVHCMVRALGPTSIDFELVWQDRNVENDGIPRNRSTVATGLLRRLGEQRIAFAGQAGPSPPPEPPVLAR